MDIVAHVFYGAAVCSRSGLAGGRTGSGASSWTRDASVGVAAGFSLLPDVVSMWVPAAWHLVAGTGNFFHAYGGNWLQVYRGMHSLVVALAVTACLCRWKRVWAVPSLAWALHIICDMVSHSAGKFRTEPFFPLSDWGVNGIAFWRHPWFLASYWMALAALLVGIALWRRGHRAGRRSTRA